MLHRARREVGRLPVVVGTLPDVVKAFVSELSEEDGELFVALKGYENRAMQILGEMMHRAPYCFGAQILRFRIPDYAQLTHDAEYLALSSVLLFVAMPFGGRTSVMLWRSESEKAGFARLLRQHGLGSEAKIREALFTVGVCYWMQEFGIEFAEAVRYAGGKSVAHARELVKKILVVDGPDDLWAITLDDAVRRADRYILLNPERSPQLPSISLPQTLLAMRQRRGVEVRQIAANAGTDSQAWVDEKLLERLIDRWGAVVTARVARDFAEGGGQREVVARVFEIIARKWASHQFFDEAAHAYRIDMSAEEQRGSLLATAAHVCENELRKKLNRELPLTSIERLAEDALPGQNRSPDDPLEIIIADETRAVVERAISRMPPAKRRIARAGLLEGLTIDELAEQCGRAPKSVSNVLSEARDLIRRELREMT